MMGVPTQYSLLAAEPHWARADVSSIRLAVVGGATMSLEVQSEWADRGVLLTQGYGLTEAAPNVLHLPAADAQEHPGAVGRPYPHLSVCVVDPVTGLALEGEATGELWCSGSECVRGLPG